MSSSRKPRRGASASRPAPVGEKLQKVLAAAGISSRRAAEELIVSGRVLVNGRPAEIGMRVDAATARIEVDGRRVATNPAYDYVMLNKPAGVVTTARDPQGRPTVVDMVKSRQRLFPVGRLDIDTVGLVILTNHGELANRLTHPRYQVPRTYVAAVEGRVEKNIVAALKRGVRLPDGPARPKAVRVLRSAARRSQIELVLTEGRKREVRRMLEAVGHPVIELARVAYGPLRLGDLRVGRSRRLTAEEIGRLLEAAGL